MLSLDLRVAWLRVLLCLVIANLAVLRVYIVFLVSELRPGENGNDRRLWRYKDFVKEGKA